MFGLSQVLKIDQYACNSIRHELLPLCTLYAISGTGRAAGGISCWKMVAPLGAWASLVWESLGVYFVYSSGYESVTAMYMCVWPG